MLKLGEELEYFTFIFERKNTDLPRIFVFPCSPILAWQKEFNLMLDTTIFVFHFIRGQKTNFASEEASPKVQDINMSIIPKLPVLQLT